MPGSRGRTAVQRRIRSIRRTGKLVTALLGKRTPGTDDFATTTQTYANAYLPPVGTTSGLGGGGYPASTVTAYLFQAGETLAPEVDDRLTVGGETFLVSSVLTRLNADAGWAVHDLRLSDEV